MLTQAQSTCVHDMHFSTFVLLTSKRVCRGELPEDMSSAYEKQRKSYEALQRTVASLADTLEKAMPDLPEPSSVTRTGDGCITVLTGRVRSAGCVRQMYTPCIEA